MKTISTCIVQHQDNQTVASTENLSSEATQITLISSSHQSHFDHIDQHFFERFKSSESMLERAVAPFTNILTVGFENTQVHRLVSGGKVFQYKLMHEINS